MRSAGTDTDSGDFIHIQNAGSRRHQALECYWKHDRTDEILNCISYSFLIGAVISAALMISSGIVCQRILYLLHYISVYFKTGKREPYYKSGMPLENFHFTVPIFLSALLYAGGVY